MATLINEDISGNNEWKFVFIIDMWCPCPASLKRGAENSRDVVHLTSCQAPFRKDAKRRSRGEHSRWGVFSPARLILSAHRKPDEGDENEDFSHRNRERQRLRADPWVCVSKCEWKLRVFPLACSGKATLADSGFHEKRLKMARWAELRSDWPRTHSRRSYHPIKIVSRIWMLLSVFLPLKKIRLMLSRLHEWKVHSRW